MLIAAVRLVTLYTCHRVFNIWRHRPEHSLLRESRIIVDEPIFFSNLSFFFKIGS